MNIDLQAAIITGGASGLGAATARLLAAKGAKVSIFDLNPLEGETIAREIGGLFQPVDVTDEGSVTAGLDAAEAAHGTARILVNCAGIAPAIKAVGREFVPHPMDSFRKAVEINLVGTFLVASRFAARLQQTKAIGEERGVIINTASVAAFDGQIGQAAYAASKGGVVGMTLPLAREFGRWQIRVMTIAPGIFWTSLLAGLPQAAQDSLAQQVPHPSRLGKPEEYAMLVDSILANPMLNGETIRLDGAIRMAAR
ncbi:SDR family NAD(P)-dependent oxidoreductase [Sphingobium sp. BS19]|uniref:SDR family NAD(P)-dependent oxidoreductase n=1 Tax=Sphingobium sp. BS19 TaxID=3018973 RepID=UPI0022EDF537|nr:SDR family NAD(P)-dependent oxidoreductase [Sphingobium sp. BS19]GLJ00682.1 3-hydroxyacyl-CoA dehydrogenase [Sphingobium sp. BS19]